MRAPDKAGPTARAWRWSSPEPDASPQLESEVATWFVSGPFHPFWSWWLVMCVDLIDRPGLPKPHLQFSGAEFEIIILSLSPDWEPDVDAKPGEVPYLTPPDLTYQFDGVRREAAEEIVGLMVAVIVGGTFSPDSDYRETWKQSLDATLAHYKQGHHDAP